MKTPDTDDAVMTQSSIKDDINVVDTTGGVNT